MSPATAKDLARCSSCGCGSLKRTALLAWHGPWPLIRPRSAAIGRAAAVGGDRDRGLTRCARVRLSSSGLRPGGRGQVGWFQPLEGSCGAEMWSSYAAWWQHSSPLGSRLIRRKLVCLSALPEAQRVRRPRTGAGHGDAPWRPLFSSSITERRIPLLASEIMHMEPVVGPRSRK
jgi:hypothetical protein